jgi:hypothetical protein
MTPATQTIVKPADQVSTAAALDLAALKTRQKAAWRASVTPEL